MGQQEILDLLKSGKTPEEIIREYDSYDNVYKAVFTRDTPASRMAISRFVSALIGRQVQVITINASEPPIENLRDRQIRFEIN